MLGTLAVVAIYLLVNVAYLRTLGLEGLAGTATPAAETAGRWMGAAGERFVSAAIAISTFGFLNLSVLAPARVYYAMAADGAFHPSLARLHPRFGTPDVAIILQAVWAIALAVTGRYEQLLSWVVFGDWIFFGLTVAGLFVLRRRLGPPASHGTPLYPWLPAFFVARGGHCRSGDDSGEPHPIRHWRAAAAGGVADLLLVHLPVARKGVVDA